MFLGIGYSGFRHLAAEHPLCVTTATRNGYDS